ncbi:MAG TPA: RNA-binding S4 domain-containing protein [Rhodospirillaceae bacterium]|nr:RNA-binding S4 domain-containing protein [Rhodospirillaceae bacterium]
MADERLRIDKWLWYARFCKTRSQAQRLVASGEISLNGHALSKAATSLRPGDELIFPLGPVLRHVQVVVLGVRRGPSAEAKKLYRDLNTEH